MLEDGGGDIIYEASQRLDSKRRQKALSVKNARAQAAAIGAGLLIQKALADYMEGARRLECPLEQQGPPGKSAVSQKPVVECFSMERLLAVLGRKVTEPCYRYGKNGKPYLENYPIQFNLSHSGDFVFCGVSEQEIGVDIQKLQGGCVLSLAKRFFADSEYRALEACGDEELRCQMFFRMWVRKEAYGKLTGEGIAGVIGRSVWEGFPAGEVHPAGVIGGSVREGFPAGEVHPAGVIGGSFREGFPAGVIGGSPRESDLIWEEYDVPDGYLMAVCRFRKGFACG